MVLTISVVTFVAAVCCVVLIGLAHWLLHYSEARWLGYILATTIFFAAPLLLITTIANLSIYYLTR